MENRMPMASVQTVTTVTSLGCCVRHAKTPALDMSQAEMCAEAGKPTCGKIRPPGLPGGNDRGPGCSP
jgi:hypothetical protein